MDQNEAPAEHQKLSRQCQRTNKAAIDYPRTAGWKQEWCCPTRPTRP